MSEIHRDSSPSPLTGEGFGAFHQGRVKAEVHPDETSRKRPHSDNERLDEALEETFPASDPVSAKHIT